MRCRACSQVPAISSGAWCGAGPGASSQRLPALQGHGLSTQERGSAPLPFTSSRGLPVPPPMLSWKSQLRPGLPTCRCRAVPALLKHYGSGWLQAPGDRESSQWKGVGCAATWPHRVIALRNFPRSRPACLSSLVTRRSAAPLRRSWPDRLARWVVVRTSSG